MDLNQFKNAGGSGNGCHAVIVQDYVHGTDIRRPSWSTVTPAPNEYIHIYFLEGLGVHYFDFGGWEINVNLVTNNSTISTSHESIMTSRRIGGIGQRGTISTSEVATPNMTPPLIGHLGEPVTVRPPGSETNFRIKYYLMRYQPIPS